MNIIGNHYLRRNHTVRGPLMDDAWLYYGRADDDPAVDALIGFPCTGPLPLLDLVPFSGMPKNASVFNEPQWRSVLLTIAGVALRQPRWYRDYPAAVVALPVLPETMWNNRWRKLMIQAGRIMGSQYGEPPIFGALNHFLYIMDPVQAVAFSASPGG